MQIMKSHNTYKRIVNLIIELLNFKHIELLNNKKTIR